MLLFGLLGFVSYRVTGRNEILRIVVFIAACKGTDMKKLLKYVFYMTTAGCLLLVILSVTGIYGRLSLETDFGRGYTTIIKLVSMIIRFYNFAFRCQYRESHTK